MFDDLRKLGTLCDDLLEQVRVLRDQLDEALELLVLGHTIVAEIQVDGAALVAEGLADQLLGANGGLVITSSARLIPQLAQLSGVVFESDLLRVDQVILEPPDDGSHVGVFEQTVPDLHRGDKASDIRPRGHDRLWHVAGFGEHRGEGDDGGIEIAVSLDFFDGALDAHVWKHSR